MAGGRRSPLEWAAMFSERVRPLSLGLLTLAIPIILVAAACTDGGEETDAGPSDTPTANIGQQSPIAPADTVIEAVTAYVTETGLDGESREVTSPINCTAFISAPEEEKPIGKICIDFNNSEFGDTSGIVEVWAYGTEAAWELTFELQNFAWVVTAVERTTPEAEQQ